MTARCSPTAYHKIFGGKKIYQISLVYDSAKTRGKEMYFVSYFYLSCCHYGSESKGPKSSNCKGNEKLTRCCYLLESKNIAYLVKLETVIKNSRNLLNLHWRVRRCQRNNHYGDKQNR